MRPAKEQTSPGRMSRLVLPLPNYQHTMKPKPLNLEVIAVRDLKKSWTLERVPKLRWSCTVTFAPQGGLHKPATLDMDQEDMETPPECGDVLMVIPPQVVGVHSRQNAKSPDVGANE